VVATYTSGKGSRGVVPYILGVILVFALIIIGFFWGKVKALADASLTQPEALAELKAKFDGTNVWDPERGLLARVTIDAVTGITKLDHHLVRVEFTFGLELTAMGEKLEADLERDSQLDWVGQCEYCGEDQPLVGATHLWGIWKLSPTQRAHSVIRFRKYDDGWRMATQ
jgi:hypothetical protein